MNKQQVDPKLVLAEYVRRFGTPPDPVTSITTSLFPLQLSFVDDKAKFKTAYCSRRSGKSVAAAAMLMLTALKHPGTNSLYITLNRLSAKRIIWKELLRFNDEFKLGAEPNASELTLTFKNKSTIYLSGAKDASEIDKFRGMHLKLTVVDEAQAFRSYLIDLIDEVLVPASYDYNGQIVMIGTPNAACAGAFYDSCFDRGRMRGWSVHKWNMNQNPFIKAKSGMDPEAIIQEELKRKGLTEDDPAHLRENRGQWVRSNDSLVYKIDRTRNVCSTVPDNLIYVLGVDLGFEDADAISVVGYHPHDPNAYVVDCWSQNKLTISDLAARVQSYVDKYDPVKCVIDAGGLGKKISEELQQRFSLPFESAEKTRKHEYIELMNDSLRTGKLQILEGLPLIEEMELLQWQYNSEGDKRIEDPRFPNHLCDSTLYAWRESKAYAFVPKEPQILPGSPEWVKREQDRMFKEAIKKLEDEMKPVDDPMHPDFFERMLDL
ncbi:hypothetical protein EBT31_12745 [bacterium]|nr:hypothetical protein [bacterium]